MFRLLAISALMAGTVALTATPAEAGRRHHRHHHDAGCYSAPVVTSYGYPTSGYSSNRAVLGYLYPLESTSPSYGVRSTSPYAAYRSRDYYGYPSYRGYSAYGNYQRHTTYPSYPDYDRYRGYGAYRGYSGYGGYDSYRGYDAYRGYDPYRGYGGYRGSTGIGVRIGSGGVDVGPLGYPGYGVGRGSVNLFGF